MINNLEDSVVQPFCNQQTPRLGKLAIISATRADFQNLKLKLRLPNTKRLYLSELCFNAADPKVPILVGPLMGAPYAVMILETLHAWGVQTIIFLGWCGSIDSDLRNGDILLPNSAIIDEGTSIHYGNQFGGIVHPCMELHSKLIKRLQQFEIAYYKGRVWSTDGIFRETPSRIEKFKMQGALAVEMELSAFCSVAKYRRLSFAAVLIVSDELFTMKWRPGLKNKRFKHSRMTVCNLLSKI